MYFLEIKLNCTHIFQKKKQLLIISALKAGGQTIALVEPLIPDALVWSSLYLKLQYSHSRKDGNKLTHGLARHSIGVLDYVQ